MQRQTAMKRRCSRTCRLDNFLKMWLLRQEKATQFSACQDKKKGGEESSEGNSPLLLVTDMKSKMVRSFCLGNATLGGCVRVGWGVGDVGGGVLFRRVETSYTIVCLFVDAIQKNVKQDNLLLYLLCWGDTQHCAPGYSSQDVPVPLLSNHNFTFFFFTFLHSGKKEMIVFPLIDCLKMSFCRIYHQ